jgi:hypothetical protein
MYGHLRAYDESTFPRASGWSLSFDHIRDYALGGSRMRRVYRSLRPRRGWLVARYDAAR